MTNYQWVVPAGGTIVSGAGTSVIQVQWSNVGVQTLYVNYTGSNGCAAVLPASKTIKVFPLPVSSIAGPGLLCAGAAGVSYTTENGMTNYSWTISPGGIITSGAATNLVGVTWNLPGMQSLSVSYTNDKGCTVAIPGLKNIAVMPLPAPTITGYDSVCLNQLADYTTEGGMSGYQWTISAGGIITSGTGSNFIHVIWTTIGTKSVTVIYVTPDGCIPASPGLKSVLVANLNPVIAGSSAVCAGASGIVYSTQQGMLNYMWTVTPGGIITSGSGTNSINVSWNTPGVQAVSVNYLNAFGCTAPNPTILPVTVNTLPVPAITGNAQLCLNPASYPYATQAGMTNYNWNITSGGGITSGQGSNVIQVIWTGAGAHSVMVSYTNASGCTSAVPGAFPVTVNGVPGSAGTVTGETLICKPRNGVVYSVAPVSSASGYLWNLPPGTIITSGANTYVITVNFSSGAQPGDIAAAGTNSCGPGTFSPSLPVAVHPYPQTPVISLKLPDTLVSSATSGNQWYYENHIIPGGTGQRQEVNKSGHYYVLVNLYGCSSDTSNVIYALAVGVEEIPTYDLTIYPNPGNGIITLRMNLEGEKKSFSFRIADLLGKDVFRMPEQMVTGLVLKEIDLGSLPVGVYTMSIQIGSQQLIRKLVIAK